MSKQRSLRIDSRLDQFIDERVGSGHYDSAEDVVEAGLRLLESEEIEMAAVKQAFDAAAGRPLSLADLRAAIREGEESGEPQEVDFDALFLDVCAEVAGKR